MRPFSSFVTAVALSVALLVPAAGIAGQSAGRPPRAARVAPPLVQTVLELNLSIDYDRPEIAGDAALTLRNDGATPVVAVPLLLNRLMTVRAVRDGAGRTLAFSSAVETFEDDPFMQVRRVTVTLPAPLAPGRLATIVVGYRGPLVGYVETGSLYIKDRIDPAFTILRSDALAFPVVGVPSDTANRAMRRPDFDFDARIDVPGNQVVATGGAQVERQAVGQRATYHFAGKRVPFLNIAVAPFAVTEREGIRVYALPDDAARAGGVAEAGRAAMTLLEKWYGPLLAQPNVTVIEIPDGFGSQASATAGIILDAAAFKDKAQLPQFYHELTHFWNARDLDTPSPRWNEGLAMFLQYRLAREIDGFAGTGAAIDRARARVCEPGNRAQLEAMPFARFGVEGKTDFSYRVGFLMFTALERLIGAEALDARLRDYLQSHLKDGGTTREFLDTLAAAPAAPAVGSFVRDWFQTSAWLAPVCGAASFDEALARWRN